MIALWSIGTMASGAGGLLVSQDCAGPFGSSGSVLKSPRQSLQRTACDSTRFLAQHGPLQTEIHGVVDDAILSFHCDKISSQRTGTIPRQVHIASVRIVSAPSVATICPPGNLHASGRNRCPLYKRPEYRGTRLQRLFGAKGEPDSLLNLLAAPFLQMCFAAKPKH